MLTTRGRYAVMAIVDIALNSSGKPVNLGDISLRQNIAQNYLEQIFVRMKNFGVVKSVRGPGGGYILSKDPIEITISYIIDAVEEEIRMTRCSKENESCTKKNAKCITHDLWHGLARHIRTYLENITVKDVLSGDIVL